MLLKCQAVSDQAVAEALCAIMLLEESSPRQALTDFLLARKAAIQKLLNQPHHGGCGFSPKCGPRAWEWSRDVLREPTVVNRGWFLLAGAGVKAQICSLVELLATTLNQAHALFYTLPEGLLPEPSLPCGLLFSTLDTITGQHPPGELLASLSYFLVHSADCYWQVPSAGYCARLWGDSSELGRCGPSFVEVAG